MARTVEATEKLDVDKCTYIVMILSESEGTCQRIVTDSVQKEVDDHLANPQKQKDLKAFAETPTSDISENYPLGSKGPKKADLDECYQLALKGAKGLDWPIKCRMMAADEREKKYKIKGNNND